MWTVPNFLKETVMIRIASQRAVTPHWHQAFLAMLPTICKTARFAFRDFDPETRAELVQEVTCNALRAYVRLVQLGKAEIAYPTVLARYGIAQVNEGRRVGGHLNVLDVASTYCQRQKGVTVEQLDKYDREEEVWREVLVEDKNAGPAEVAAARIDFTAWLRVLPGRLRRIAKILALGETTTAVSRRFCVSPSRISQFRRELQHSWEHFQGEPMGTRSAALA
jgi:hypothetical protein